METETNIWVTIFTSPAFLAVLIAAISSILTYFGKRLNKWMKVKMGLQDFEAAVEIAKIIVEGIQQTAKKYGWDGKAKFEQAMVQLRIWGTQHGIKYTDEQWESIVEQAVFQLKGFMDEVIDTEEEVEETTETPVTTP